MTERTIYIIENSDKSRRIEVDATEEALTRWLQHGWAVVGWYENMVDYRAELERQNRVLDSNAQTGL